MKKKIGLIALAAAVSLGGNMAFAALPQGATPLAYIRGDKNTYLDTGWTICPTSDVFEAVITIVDNTTAAFWCSRGKSGSKFLSSVTMFDYGPSYMRADYNEYTSEISRNIKLFTGQPYTITVSNGTTVVSNGARVDIPMVSSFTNTPGPLILFASGYYANGVFNDAGNFGNYSLHSFKIWRNGVLVRDFVPVRANNVVTLADAVEGGVLTPLGTGVFTAGQNLDTIASPLAATVPPQLAREGAPEARPVLSVTDAATGDPLLEGVDYEVDYELCKDNEHGRALVRPLVGSAHARKPVRVANYEIQPAPPPGYTRLEYVQGDGRAYWLTDYLPQPTNDQIDVDFAFTAINTYGLFCAREGVNSKSWCFCFIKSGNTVTRRLDYNAKQRVYTSSREFRLGERYRLTVANKTGRTSSGDSYSADKDDDIPLALGEAGDVLAIFAYYSNGAGNGVASQSTQRLYRFSVRRSGRLIHDWVPVLTPEGVATLYDLVEDKALTPQGSGAFIAGPAVGGVEVAPIPVQTLPAGGSCTPAPVVTLAGAGVRLVAGTDYTVSYANNNQAGLATLTVTGAGRYAGIGSATVPFNISLPPPVGVTRLDYIQGDGATRLLTDWTINPQTDRVETEIMLTDIANAAIWCSRGGNQTDRSFTLFRLAGDTVRLDCGSDNSGQYTLGWAGLFPCGVKLPITAHGADCSVGEVRSRRVVNASFTQAGGPLMLFASYYGSTANNIQFLGRNRMYEFRVFRQGVLVRRWVPVRTAGGVATMCDLMTGNTITPSGSGAFIAGPELADFDLFVSDQAWDGEPRHAPRPFVAATNRTTGVALEPGRDYTVTYTNNAAEGWARAIGSGAAGSAYAGQGASADFRVIRALPEGYERLEYVEGDGASALKTDYVPTPATDTLTLDFKMRDTQGSLGILCARQGATQASWSLCWDGGGARLRFDSNNCQSNWTFGAVFNGDMRHKIKLANRIATADCASSMTAATAPATAGGALTLLAYYNDSTTRVPTSCSAVRIYGCQVVRSGALIHDWVPVRTPEGVVTLYDRVDGTTPEHAGTGHLIAGPSWAHEGPVIFPKGTMMIIR
ncbi:MAG: hypothetical protein IJL17_10030 [Kiritimatiellae bacterium]|nr:hypothetical protein [Kiritimatiellia bacterium]